MRKHVEQKEGYRIIRRGDVSLSLSPIECPLCLCVVIDEMDTLSISRSGCCLDCEHEVADADRKVWIEGRRPSQEEIVAIKTRRLSSPHSRRHI
jgi:hypothetical protein